MNSPAWIVQCHSSSAIVKQLQLKFLNCKFMSCKLGSCSQNPLSCVACQGVLSQSLVSPVFPVLPGPSLLLQPTHSSSTSLTICPVLGFSCLSSTGASQLHAVCEHAGPHVFNTPALLVWKSQRKMLITTDDEFPKHIKGKRLTIVQALCSLKISSVRFQKCGSEKLKSVPEWGNSKFPIVHNTSCAVSMALCFHS